MTRNVFLFTILVILQECNLFVKFFVANINDLEEFAKFYPFFANGKLFGLFELN
jgi:hypothetical protein